MAAHGLKNNALCGSYTAGWEVTPLHIHSTTEYSRQQHENLVLKITIQQCN